MSFLAVNKSFFFFFVRIYSYFVSFNFYSLNMIIPQNDKLFIGFAFLFLFFFNYF